MRPFMSGRSHTSLQSIICPIGGSAYFGCEDFQKHCILAIGHCISNLFNACENVLNDLYNMHLMSDKSFKIQMSLFLRNNYRLGRITNAKIPSLSSFSPHDRSIHDVLGSGDHKC